MAKNEQAEKDFMEYRDMMMSTLEGAGVGFVGYMWEPELDLGIGFNSKDCDAADALVCICRIAKAFHLDPDAIHEAMVKLSKEGDENRDGKNTGNTY